MIVDTENPDCDVLPEYLIYVDAGIAIFTILALFRPTTLVERGTGCDINPVYTLRVDAV
jgi:hypothetical protein